MKSIFHSLLLTACLITLMAGCSRMPADPPWPQRATGKFELPGWEIDTVFIGEAFKSFLPRFVNERAGYLVGENYGDLLKTTDGGTTWRQLSAWPALSSMGGVIYSDIDFINEQTGFVAVHDLFGCPNNCRNLATLLTTADGGTTWRLVQANLNRWLTEIHFSSPTEGVAVGLASTISTTGVYTSSMELLQTNDGGKSWTKFDSILPTNIRGCLHFMNRQIGFLQGTNRIFYRTQDGGRTWETFANAIDSRQFRFVTPQRGFATNAEGFFSTEDGGKTWIRRLEGPSELIGFPSQTEGFFIRTIRSYPNDVPDFDAEVLRTTDGGQTWQRSEPIYNLSVRHPFQFPSAQVGFTSIGSRILRLRRR
jgi:photosystem II stability/assembly factor-like uncharacterized protein